MLGTMVTVCTASFTSQEGLEKVQNFFKQHSTKGFDQGLAQSCDSIRAKSNWVARDRKDVEEWVKAYQPKTINAEL